MFKFKFSLTHIFGIFLFVRFFNRVYFKDISYFNSGNLFLCPSKFPTNLFLTVNDGSKFKPIPINPPGIAYYNSFYSDLKLNTSAYKGLYSLKLLSGFYINKPGLISILSPNLIIPFLTVPPTTPPYN